MVSFGIIPTFRQSMKKKVTIVTMNPYFSIENANSAVSIYLKTIGDFLVGQGYEVRYFPDRKSNSTASPTASRGLMSSIKKLAKTFFPNYYFRKRFNKYFADVEDLHQEAESFLKDSDFLIEFSAYGGNIGSRLKGKYPMKIISIYDAPLHLQFEEMYQETGKFSEIIKSSENKFVIDADLLICYSDAVKDYLQKQYPISSNIAVLPCIVWKSNLLPLRNEHSVIGFIGSFLQWHQPLLLVKAFEAIAPDFPNTTLLMIGYGQEWTSTQEYCSNSPVKQRIQLTGFVSEEELTQLRSTFTIGVMPGSNWYGSPLKLFEYAENGIPVIAPSTPTVSQYFKHMENALLIDSKDEMNDLIRHLRAYLTNEALRQQMSKEGLRMMQGDLSMEKVMTKFVQHIQNL